VASNNIARLGVILGLDSAEFVKGLDAANKKLYDFSVKAAGVAKDALLASGAAFAAATYNAMQFADAIADVAKANDVSIASILKLNNALANAGGEAENSGKLLASFTGFMDKAAAGSFEAQKSLQMAGVSLKDLANLGTEDLFAKTVQGIAEIEDPLTRNARAMEMFGKAAKGVDFVGLAEEMRKASTATDEQAIAVQAAADAYDLIKQRGREFQLSFTSEIGPSLLLATEYFLDLGTEINKTGGLWKSVFDTVAYQAASLVHEIKDLISVFIAWDAVLNAFFEARWGEIDGIVSRRYAERASEEAKLEAFRQKLEGIQGGVKEGERGDWENGPKKKGTAGGPKRLVTPGIDREAERARKEAEREAKEAARLAEEARKKQLALEMKGMQAQLEMREQVWREQAAASDAAMQAEAKLLESRNAAIELGRQTAQEQRDEARAAQDAYNDSVARAEGKLLDSRLAAIELGKQARLEERDAARAAIDAQSEAYQRAQGYQRELQAMQAQDLERAHELFILEANAAQLVPEKLAMEREYLRIRNRHLDAVKAINENQSLDSNARIEALATEEELMKRQLELATERYRINKEITDQQKTFSAGWTRAFDAYIKNAEDAGKKGEQAFQIFTDNIGRSIDELVDKGETSFARLTESILKDMTKIYLKQLMMKAIGGGAEAGSGIFGMFKGMFGGGIDVSGGGAELHGAYLPMHATGGNVAANSPSWVGERGPELFVPNQSGMIVPNNSIGDSMGSQPANVYNGPYIANMSAIDTQSGLQFLAKNKQGVWASYQSANRSIPMSR